MKNKLVIIIAMLTIVIGLCGCASEAEKERLKNECQTLRNEITLLKEEKNELDNLIVDTKVEKGIATYMVEIKIGQSHAFYDYENSLKDSMNDTTITIEVSEDFYNSVEVGTVLNNSFRMGSYMMSGSVGSWDISVSNKWIK